MGLELFLYGPGRFQSTLFAYHARRRGFGVQAHILCHCHQRHQVALLINHTYARRNGVSHASEVHGLAVEAYFAAVALINARNHFTYGALAGAVLAHQCDYLLLFNFEGYVVHRHKASELLPDLVQF